MIKRSPLNQQKLRHIAKEITKENNCSDQRISLAVSRIRNYVVSSKPGKVRPKATPSRDSSRKVASPRVPHIKQKKPVFSKSMTSKGVDCLERFRRELPYRDVNLTTYLFENQTDAKVVWSELKSMDTLLHSKYKFINLKSALINCLYQKKVIDKGLGAFVKKNSFIQQISAVDTEAIIHDEDCINFLDE